MMRWVRLGAACALAMGLLGCPETAEEPAIDAFIGGSVRDQGALRDAAVDGPDIGADVRDAATGRDAAVPCQADAECPDGQYCDESGACLVGCRVGGCAEGQACDPQTRQCVAEPECRSDFDCEAGADCVDGACVAPPGCMRDADCAPGEVCEAGECVDEPPPPGCQGDADCEPGEACLMGLCVENPGCADDLDCGLDERCVDGACLPGAPECVNDAECGPGEACQAGACVRVGECAEDADCPLDQRCVDMACVPAEPQADACLAPLPGRLGRFAGRTDGAQPIHGATCGAGATGPEVAYRLRFEADTTVCLDLTGSDFDTVLYVRAEICGAPAGEVGCNDDEREITGGVQSALTLEAAGGTDYFVFVDGFGEAAGAYTLQISEGPCAAPAACADDFDCEPGQVCLAGVCEQAPPACLDDADCAEGEACVAGACVPDQPPCVADLDCGLGEVCEAGQCVPAPACADDADCGLGEVCEAGQCVAPPACADDADCAEGERCDNGACVGLPLACQFALNYLPGGRVAGSSAQAPAEVSGSCGGDGAEAGYRFVAAQDGPVCLSTAGSQFDTVLYVRAGCLGDEVACNDDFNGLQSQVQVQAVAGTEYFVFIDGFAAGGDFVLSGFSGACDAPPACGQDADCGDGERCVDGACVDDRPPACQAAEVVGLGRFQGDSRLAQSAERGSCGGGGGEVVRTLRVDAETPVCARTAGSGFDTVLYVRGGDCAAGEELACDDDGGEGLTSQLEFVASPGVDYHVFVDALVGGGDWVLSLTPGGCDAAPGCAADADCAAGEACVAFECVPAPAGACANPLPLPAGEPQAGATAEGAGALGATCGGDGSPEQVYRFVAAEAGPVCFSTAGSGFDTVLSVREGDCAGAEVACNDDAAALAAGASQVQLDAAAGAAYAVVVDGFVGFDGDPAFGDFQILATAGPCEADPAECAADGDCGAGERCVDGACVPDAPACVDPQPLALGVPVQGDSAGAPATIRGSCGGNGAEAVFALQVDAPGPVCLSTDGSAFDTVLHVRADACADAAAEVACDDDGGAGLQSEVQLQAEVGVTYFVAVDGFNAGGAFNLVAQPGECGAVGPACVLDLDCLPGEACQDGVCVAQPPPDCLDDLDCAEGEICEAGACVAAPDDACGAAQAVALPTRVRGTTEGPNDFQGQCGGRGPEAVYTFTAEADGVVCADTTGSGYDTLLFVRQAACGDGAEVACNDDAVGLRARVEFAVTGGEDYFVFVDGFNGGGDYALSLFDGPCAQAPECFRDVDCPAGQVCGPDATCQPAPPAPCEADADCAAGLACQAGECRPAAGGTCDLPSLIEGEGVFEGSTVEAPAAVGAECGGGAGSAEAVFEFRPAAAGDWCFTTTGSLYDTVLHVRSPDCDGDALACNDDSPLAGGLQSALTLPVQADGNYYLFVDGFGANSAGPFTLNVSAGACE